MQTPFTDREMRDALSTFATGVTVVTGLDADKQPIGMTASSFNSVSMDPPLILWSVAKNALSADAFREADHFAVHVLDREQVDVSSCFAQTGTDKFSAANFTTDTNGVPVLDRCACRFDCAQWASYEGGDHWIIVGRVIALHRSSSEPLVFSGGSYAVASPLRVPSQTGSAAESEDSPIDGLLIYNLARAYRQIADQFHESVRQSDLTVAEWRILASLHGVTWRELRDLSVRTFIDLAVLRDMIDKMRDDGLCKVMADYDKVLVSETKDGHSRVEHLFALSAEQERSAVGESQPEKLQQLITLLQSVIANTDN